MKKSRNLLMVFNGIACYFLGFKLVLTDSPLSRKFEVDVFVTQDREFEVRVKSSVGNAIPDETFTDLPDTLRVKY